MSEENKAALGALQDGFVSIADTVEPSVVTVSARAPEREPSRTRPMQNPGDRDVPEPFRDFFRQLPRPDGPDESEPRGTSTGSGVIIRETGNTVYVLTNNHVVDTRGKFRCELFDHTEYNADLVGTDARTDLAVLKFQVKRPLPAGTVAHLGNSDDVKVGQWAIAIGSPLGYDQTLTVGVISAKGRALESIGRSAANYVDLLQTDASINPGNSGGPLVNIEGRVVGVNVAIASSGMSQGNIGIGFAIPINTAKMVAEQLMDKGKVVRGYLGVAVSPANRELCVELRDQLKCYEGGALIETVNPNTPAAKAGVKEGDVIVKFGSLDVHNFTDLEKAVAVTRPGDTIPADVIREGKQVRLNITVMERPSEDPLIKGSGGGGEPRPGRRSGPGREQPETGTRLKYGLNVRPAADGKGLEITGVTVGSPAFESGLQAGDVITQVGPEPVTSVDALQKALNAAPTDQGIVLRVMTPQGMRFVVVRP